MSALSIASSYPLLAAAVLIGALGLPLPLSVTLAAAGALARQGHLRLSLLLVICTAAAVLGDCLGYGAGRIGRRVLPALPYTIPAAGRRRAAWDACTSISSRMGLLVFLTRWAFTAPAPMVNVVAGARRYPWRRFLLIDTGGEALWCVTALAPGYALGGISGYGTPLAIAAGVLLTLIGAVLAPRLRIDRPSPLPIPTQGQQAA